MTKAGKRKPRKAPPPSVLSFKFADDSTLGMPTAEAVAQQIEQAAKLKALANAEFEWLREHGASEVDAEVSRQRTLATAERIRDVAVAQLQWIIDTAVHHLRIADIAAQRSAQTRAAAGTITRKQFAVALAAVVASGQEPTATTILDNWPTESRPMVRRVQQLLEEHRQA
jgi:hypothetical protein